MSTTTITPTVETTIPLLYRLTAPLHHGAGTAGNTSLLRTHEVVQQDGTHASIPFVSANSIRHHLRASLAWHLVHTLDVQPGTLTKGVVDLLWSGGAVTTTGAQVDLEQQRQIEELFPALNLLGYAAHSDIVGGTLRTSDLELVCQENAWRLPQAALTLPQVGQGAAAFRDEEFGTRHDVKSTPVARLIAQSDTLLGDKQPTTQMIYSTQVVIAGAVLSGSILLTPSATEAHKTALLAALALWAHGGHVYLGAKSGQGYGAADVQGLPDGTDQALDRWTSHVWENGEKILTLLKAVAE